jgi:hypothetical protein
MIRKYSVVLVAAASILAAAILFFMPSKTVVTVTNVQTRQPIVYLQLNEGEEFIIGFTHSVNKRQVYDYIRVDQENLLIVKSRYDAFGAGMPEVAPAGAVLQIVDGILELSNINLPRREIGLFIGTIANHTLTVKGNTLVLADIVPPGTHLKFKITRISYLDMWKGRCL